MSTWFLDSELHINLLHINLLDAEAGAIQQFSYMSIQPHL